MKNWILPPLFLSLTAFGCSATGNGDSKAAATPSMEEVTAAMTRAGTPGAHHKALDAFVGSWNAKMTMWMEPGKPPMESTGSMVNSWIYDGRYLDQKFEGDFMGMPFHGTGMWGFDVAANQYIGFWYDSGSTGIANSTGPIPADGKTFTLHSVMTDPMSGKPSTGDTVTTIDNANQHTMTMYENRGGERVKTMVIVFTRK